MIRTLQAIDWGLLAPYPIAVHRRVSVFAGQNGSGKSSAMDACKAILGVNRFGQSRSAASYINSGRDLAPPASEALIVCCCELPKAQSQSLSFCDEQGRFTLLLQVTRSRRLFLAVAGHTVLGIGSSLQDDIKALYDEHPRKSWLNPEDYQRRVLDPIGATRAVQTILSIPQGESQRLLDARPDRLLRDLLSIMGALEPLTELDLRRGEYDRAKDERERAHRALLEEQLQTERAIQQLSEKAGELPVIQGALEQTEQQARGALAHARTALAADRHQASTAARDAREDLSDAQADLASTRESEHRAASAPRDYHAARAARDQLVERGVEAQLVGEHVDETARDSGQAAAMRSTLCAVVIDDIGWAAALEIAEQHPDVTFVQASSAAEFWSSEAPDLASLEVRGTHVQVNGTRLVPNVEVTVPFQAPDPESTQKAQRAVWDAEQRLASATQDLGRLDRREKELTEIDSDLGPGEQVEADVEELAGLIAQRRRLRERIGQLERQARKQQQLQQQLDRCRVRQDEAQALLDGQEQALEQAHGALVGAREAYQRQVRTLVKSLDRYFQELCADASMRGELELTVDPLAEAGGRLHVRVAESPDAPLRDYADADLSGGWRAKCAVLTLLAALCAAGGEKVLNCVLLDEHAAQLDEDRQQELGSVFQLLSRRRTMQFILTMPTKRSSEQVAWADLQVAFLKAASNQRYAPLPHLLEATEEATDPANL